MKGAHTASDAIPGLDRTVGDFWSWAFSDLNQNTVRSLFAEYLVGSLLGVRSHGRTEWDAYDLLYRPVRIEVKSSAYVQSWHQDALSTPRFDIAPKRTFEEKTNRLVGPCERHADVYVFALYTEKDRATANPLDVAGWRFWVVSTAALDAQLGEQKSLGLGTLGRFTAPVAAAGLQVRVDAVARRGEAG